VGEKNTCPILISIQVRYRYHPQVKNRPHTHEYGIPRSKLPSLRVTHVSLSYSIAHSTVVTGSRSSPETSFQTAKAHQPTQPRTQHSPTDIMTPFMGPLDQRPIPSFLLALQGAHHLYTFLYLPRAPQNLTQPV
jgi:hypothetical protein